MAHELKDLLESGLLDEASKAKISEAWEQRLTAARESQAAELREEFATRYDNDKSRLVEAMDTMLQEAIEKEITEFNEDRKGLVEQRLAYKRKLREHTKVLDKFVMEQVAKEVKELRADRKIQQAATANLEEFVIKTLSSEVTELNEDMKSLADAKVKVIREGKIALAQAKKDFVKRSSKVVEATVGKVLRSEMTQLKEDIEAARKNNFGRKIFESFAAEYVSSYLSENTEVKKLAAEVRAVQSQNKKLKESLDGANKKTRIVESRLERDRVLTGLMTPLSKEKRALMTELLEGVSTPKLKETFKRYLPAVLNESAKSPSSVSSRVTKKDVTGNRSNLNESRNTRQKIEESTQSDDELEILSYKKLAGIK